MLLLQHNFVKIMPCVKNNSNESEGEEMGQESPESEKSSREDSDDSSPGSDEDDSSEMDEETCEKRKTECMDDMADLERHFLYLKEQLYQERIAQITCKLEEVRAGRASEYLQPLKELQDNMRIRTEVAGILRDLRLANVRNIFEAEQLAASQNFESEKMILMDMMSGELLEKLRKLDEDRNNVDISSDLWNERLSSKKNKKKVFDSSLERRRKPVTVTGPYIVYMLTDSDILEDWTAIRKALKSRRSRAHLF